MNYKPFRFLFKLSGVLLLPFIIIVALVSKKNHQEQDKQHNTTPADIADKKETPKTNYTRYEPYIMGPHFIDSLAKTGVDTVISYYYSCAMCAPDYGNEPFYIYWINKGKPYATEIDLENKYPVVLVPPFDLTYLAQNFVAIKNERKIEPKYDTTNVPKGTILITTTETSDGEALDMTVRLGKEKTQFYFHNGGGQEEAFGKRWIFMDKFRAYLYDVGAYKGFPAWTKDSAVKTSRGIQEKLFSSENLVDSLMKKGVDTVIRYYSCCSLCHADCPCYVYWEKNGRPHLQKFTNRLTYDRVDYVYFPLDYLGRNLSRIKSEKIKIPIEEASDQEYHTMKIILPKQRINYDISEEEYDLNTDSPRVILIDRFKAFLFGVPTVKWKAHNTPTKN